MKKVIVFFLLISTVLCTFGCNKGPIVVPMATEIIEKSFADVQPLDVASLTPDKTFICRNKDVMSFYYKMTLEQMQGACKYYEEQGYEQYSYHDAGGNISVTYVKDAQMAHLYWIKCEKRLTIVTSETNGTLLPVKNPETRTGSYKTTVTQVQSPQINGMGYIFKLADGSYIVYDGGHDEDVDGFWKTLKDLTPKGDKIIIRAWLITHSHGDHHGVVEYFAEKYADQVTVERFLISPATEEVRGGESNYLGKKFLEQAKKFTGAEVCYVYTGMVFTFCNLRMEILMTYEDTYYTGVMPSDFNNTSIISRIYADDYNMILLADSGNDATEILAAYYGDYLKSDMCQISHHGVEDCPLIVYRHIKAPILWYPCDLSLYNLPKRDDDVRKALRKSKYTSEIIIHDAAVTKEFRNE